MELVFQIGVILHVLFAMTWFGAGLTLPRRLREGIAQGRPGAVLAAQDADRAVRIVLMAAVLTLLTGLALVFTGGGFAVAPRRIHLGLGLSVLALLVVFFGVRPTVRRARELIEGQGELALATPLAKRASMLHGMTHLLFLIVLVLMLWRL